MIKNLLLFSALSCGALNVSIAQESYRTVPRPFTGGVVSYLQPFTPQPSAAEDNGPTRASVCTDKVTYVDRNAEDLPAYIGGTNFEIVIQKFPDLTGQVTKVDFQAAAFTTGIKTVTVVLYNAAGSAIGNTTATVNSTTSSNFTATFASAVNVTNGFSIGILPPAGDSVKIFSNTNGSGLGLSSAGYQGQLLNFLDDTNQDFDFLMRPTIKFTLVNPVLTASTLSTCTGQAVNFTEAPASALPAFYTSDIYSPTGVLGKPIVYGDGTPNGTTVPVSHTYTTTGSKEASMTYVYDGWTTDCVSDPSTQTIVVNPGAQSDFAWTSVHLAVTFYNTSSNATSYSWAFGDGGTASAPNPVHNYTAPGTYTVELTATGPCGTAQHFTNITITATTNEGNLGVDENESALLNVYPNPSTDNVNVAITLEKTEDVSIIVLDALGRTVYTQNLGAVQSLVQPVDLSAYRAGVYMMRIVHDGAISTRSFVKQ